MDANYQLPVGAEEEPLSGKGEGTQSLMTLGHPVSATQPDVGAENMADEIEVSTSQHDILKPDDPLANPKKPNKMRYDKSSTHHKKGSVA